MRILWHSNQLKDQVENAYNRAYQAICHWRLGEGCLHSLDSSKSPVQGKADDPEPKDVEELAAAVDSTEDDESPVVDGVVMESPEPNKVTFEENWTADVAKVSPVLSVELPSS